MGRRGFRRGVTWTEKKVRNDEIAEICVGAECCSDSLRIVSYVGIGRVRFARVLQNILDNANKYAGESPVTVSLYETKASVIIAVTDTGCGIPKDAVDKIFTRFYRVNDARTADGSGGLGLAIAKQLTEGLGGKIWAVSEEGKGTSIRIALPKEDGDETNPDH